MIRFLVIFSFFNLLAYGDIYSDFAINVKKTRYVKACKIGKKIVARGERDEKVLSLIGTICLKADYIDTAGSLQSKLRKTQNGRKNSTIFSSLVLQKRLIYQFMYDDIDISTLALPITQHPLSVTFIAIRDNNFKVISDNPKTIEFKQNSKLYRVYIDKKDRGRIVIVVKDSDGRKSTHRYL